PRALGRRGTVPPHRRPLRPRGAESGARRDRGDRCRADPLKCLLPHHTDSPGNPPLRSPFFPICPPSFAPHPVSVPSCSPSLSVEPHSRPQPTPPPRPSLPTILSSGPTCPTSPSSV